MLTAECGLQQANLSNADLSHADMRGANLNQANLEYAILKYCFVYGISDWNTNLDGAVQKKLSICQNKTYSMYVDCIENARLKLIEMSSQDLPEIYQSAKKLQTNISENRLSFKEKLAKIQELK